MDLIIDSSEKKYSDFLEKITWKNFSPLIKEQLYFRIYICKDCVSNNKCFFCKCNLIDCITDYISCNKTKRFPNFKNSNDWDIFKKQHNIIIL